MIWNRYVKCSNSDCKVKGTYPIFVKSKNKVYMQTAYDLNDRHVLLLTLNASDGTYTSNPYIWNSS